MRNFLTPRWTLLHLLFLAAALGTGWLAVWQWDRAHEAGGGAQNYGYALQWPLFGAFVLFLWFRLLRAEYHEAARPEQDSANAADAEGPENGDAPAGSSHEDESTPHGRPPGRRLVPEPASRGAEPDDDPALAEYNRYLARLHAANQRE